MVEYVEVPYDNCLCETEKAVQLELTNGETVWVPRSLLDRDEQVPEPNDNGGEYGACFIAHWWTVEHIGEIPPREVR